MTYFSDGIRVSYQTIKCSYSGKINRTLYCIELLCHRRSGSANVDWLQMQC